MKGYEIRKGEFLVFEPDELKAAMPESDRKIRIDKFVYYLSLDPVYFETSYILVPDRSEEAYSLLAHRPCRNSGGLRPARSRSGPRSTRSWCMCTTVRSS